MTQVLDLMPGYRRTERLRRRRVRAWATAVAVYATVLAAGGATAFVGTSDTNDSRDALREANQSLDTARATAAELSAELAQLEGTLRGARAAEGRPDWSLLLGFIATIAGKEAVLDQLTVAPHPEALDTEAFEIRLVGRATSAGVTASIASRLEASGVFAEVRQRGSAGGRTGREVRFEITAQIGIPTPPPDAELEAEEGARSP
jgi:hypothetical protein